MDTTAKDGANGFKGHHQYHLVLHYYGNHLQYTKVNLCPQSRIPKSASLLVEKQREEIAERLLDGLDKETRGELSDNIWLKKEVYTMQLLN